LFFASKGEVMLRKILSIPGFLKNLKNDIQFQNEIIKNIIEDSKTVASSLNSVVIMAQAMAIRIQQIEESLEDKGIEVKGREDSSALH
jgi:hypothetical protein